MSILRNRSLGAATLCLVGTLATAVAFAQAAYEFNLPQQSLADALRAIGRQTTINILFEPQTVENLTAPAVRGLLSPEEAVKRVLAGTQLKVEQTAANSMLIARAQTTSKEGGAAADLSSVAWDQSSMQLASSEPHRGADSTRPGRDFGSSSQSESAPNEVAKPQLDEIVVTATKRAESLQDIPLSVTALDEQLLVKTGAVDLIDYATRVPNLSFGATGAGPLSLFTMQIRGVAGGGTTGFYIDDVPVPESMNPRVMDISRIEVLRGPQGSLYGARSMGGTVRLITKRADPTATEFKTHATLGAVAEGGLDYAVDSAFNVPISSNLAFRGNAYYQLQTGVHDIVVDNPNVAGDEISHKNADEGEYWGLQAMATWNPTEHLTVEPRFMYQKSHLDWVPYSDLRPGNFIARRVIDRADPNDVEWSISSLTVSRDTDWGHFTSATAFLNQEGNGGEEFSEFMNFLSGAFGGDPNYYPPGGSLITANVESRQITEEARFTSEFDGRLQLTAGVFYSKNKQDILAPCSFAVGFSEATGIPFGTDCIYSAEYRTEIEEAAVFGELEYAVLDNLFLTLGGRYFDNTFTRSALESGLLIDFGGPSGPRRSGEQSENGFNPKIALKWDVTGDWTLYSSAAKGYRIGGANLNAVPASACAADLAALGLSAAPETFDSDSLWSYEIGSKSANANRRFSLNAAAFFIDWKDIIQGTNLSCGFGFTNNTGKAEIKGAEVEITGQAIHNLHYALGIGYTDAEITDPEDAAGVLKGDPIAQVPEWTFNGNVDYQFNIGARDAYFFLSYSWVDSSISVNQGRAAPRLRDAYDLLDARLGMTFGKWDISLSGKNLTNQHANLSDNLSNAAEDPRRPRYVTNRPRTLGVDVRWSF